MALLLPHSATIATTGLVKVLLCEPAGNGANVQLLLLDKAEGDLARHGGVIGVLLHPGSLPRLHSGNVGNNLLSGQH